MDEGETSLGLGLEEPAQPKGADAYRVLARKYRPQDFTGLIGQDALVRTLSNAFASGRIAHAFMLTGVRGVGKTTTARIIARALTASGRTVLSESRRFIPVACASPVSPSPNPATWMCRRWTAPPITAWRKFGRS